MLKISKILVILFIILFLLNITVFATDINMNLTQDETATNETDIENIQDNLDDTFEATPDGIDGDATPSGVSSIAQENMSFSNILNILIITVGVILILLAIAILIRLKN